MEEDCAEFDTREKVWSEMAGVRVKDKKTAKIPKRGRK